MERTELNDVVLNSPLFQSELRFYGLPVDSARLVRNKEGVIVARVNNNGEAAVLKCFETAAFRREIQNYEILQSCGVQTIRVLGKSERSILLEDIDASETFRLGEETDLDDSTVIRSIAKWYKTLHANGSLYVQQCGEGLYEEWDCFTMENLMAVQKRFGLDDCDGLKAIADNFEMLRAKMDSAPRTLTYNDFYYTNMVVRKDLSEALMFDYNLLGKGCYISDIRNVVYWLSEENRKLFFSVYGEADDELLLLDMISSPVISLYSAMKREIFPEWAEEAVRELDAVPELITRLFK